MLKRLFGCALLFAALAVSIAFADEWTDWQAMRSKMNTARTNANADLLTATGTYFGNDSLMTELNSRMLDAADDGVFAGGANADLWNNFYGAYSEGYQPNMANASASIVSAQANNTTAEPAWAQANSYANAAQSNWQQWHVEDTLNLSRATNKGQEAYDAFNA